MADTFSQRRVAPRPRNLERAVAMLVLVGGAPAVAFAAYLLWREPVAENDRWALLGLIIGIWLVSASTAHRFAVESLNLIASLLGAFREGDYSIRGPGTDRGSSLATIMREVNDLGSTLQRQRTEAIESSALLTQVMQEIHVAVFAFDPANRLTLANKAAQALVGQPVEALVGLPASTLGLDEFLTGQPRRTVDRAFGGRRGRFDVRRAVFYRDGRAHDLVVLTDISQALREQEEAAWQRIVRVLSHEINNSLAPIKSIAHSLRRIVDRAPDFPRTNEVRHGLSLIEERSGALGRFLRSYAQLARLPKANPRKVNVSGLVERIVELEKRLPVVVQPSPPVIVNADSDQLEQLLINIVRNAVDASLETGGRVVVGWQRSADWLELYIEDEGKGLPETSNLFVPFFTTKASGSGIGLALSRQIAEAHGGSITLENRAAGTGCRATLRLPM